MRHIYIYMCVCVCVCVCHGNFINFVIFYEEILSKPETFSGDVANMKGTVTELCTERRQLVYVACVLLLCLMI